MRNLGILFAGFVAIAGLGACGDEPPVGDDVIEPDADPSVPDAIPGAETIRVGDDIGEDTTWITGNTYVIPRLKPLFVLPGATLTIEPGVVVKGEQGSLLVITRGAKIEAVGTPEQPIILTSSQNDAAKTRGFWGGLLILGAAPINNNVLSTPTSTEATFEAFTSSIAEGKFGGTTPADDSGTVKYMRIEFAGFNFVSDREFNNLTLAGVGSGTEIDYVQVHGGADDGIEFFGGTVNVKHILISQNGDDGFDTDNGWSGKAQFIVHQNVRPNGVGEAANGMESDNHATAFTAEPRTLPTIYNMTVIGDRTYTAGTSFAAVLRRGTGGHYKNVIITAHPGPIECRDQATQDQLTAGNLDFQNSIFYNNGVDTSGPADGIGDNFPVAATTPVDIVESTVFTNAAWNNRFADPGLSSSGMVSLTAPDFKPRSDGAAMTGGATPPNDGFFDVTATYVGAFGATDWTAGWTAFPQPVN